MFDTAIGLSKSMNPIDYEISMVIFRILSHFEILRIQIDWSIEFWFITVL